MKKYAIALYHKLKGENEVFIVQASSQSEAMNKLCKQVLNKDFSPCVPMGFDDYVFEFKFCDIIPSMPIEI